jgi:hypothetical protein
MDLLAMGKVSEEIICNWRPELFGHGLDMAVATAMKEETSAASLLDTLVLRAVALP